MAIQYPNFPLLNPQQMGRPNIPEAAKSGISVVDSIIGAKLKNMQQQELAEKMPYVGQQAAADVEKTQLANQFYPEVTQSEIGLRGAQAGKLNKETQWYDTEAQSNVDYRKSIAKKAEQEAQQLQYMTDRLKQMPQYAGGAVSPQTAGAPGTSYYGVETPRPTADDIINAKFGVGTFGGQLKNSLEQQAEQRKSFIEKTQKINEAVEKSLNFQRQLGQYNQLMDDTLLSGRIGGKLPAELSSTAQSLEDVVVNQMGKTGVEQMREAMDSARFSNLDMNLAQKLKPQRTWSDATRSLYTDFSKAAHERLVEQAQFYDTVRNNPQLGLNAANTDAAWRAVQTNYPISDGGAKVLPSEDRMNKWQQFLTPEAIDSIKKTGNYDPKKMEKNRKEKEKNDVIKIGRDENGKLVRSS